MTQVVSTRSQKDKQGLKNTCSLLTTLGTLLLLKSGPLAHAIPAYDCEAPNATTSTISLEGPATCPPFDEVYGPEEQRRVQILQTTSHTKVAGYSCKVQISRTACRCQFLTSSHFGCQETATDELIDISPRECRKVIRTGRYRNDEIELTNIAIGRKYTRTYFSHGKLNEDHTCQTTSFTRKGVKYVKSYEQTSLSIQVSATLGETTSPQIATDGGDDVVFSNGIQTAASDRSFQSYQFGTTVWNYTKPGCSQLVEQSQVVELYSGPVQVRTMLKSAPDNALKDALITVNPNNTDVNRLPKAFGLALKFRSSVCGSEAYQTNIAGVLLVFLRPGDTGIKVSNKSMIENPYLTSYITQNTLSHIKTNMHWMGAVRDMYNHICENERSSLQNKLNLLAATSSPYSLEPLLGVGYTSVHAGSALHIIECVREEVSLRTDYKGCAEQIPVWRTERAENGTLLQVPFFMDPILRTLSPIPSLLLCDNRLPVVYHVEEDHWVCNYGNGLAKCPPPTIVQPQSAGLTKLSFNFVAHLGHGIQTPHEIMQHRARVNIYTIGKALMDEAVSANANAGQIQPGGTVGFILGHAQTERLKRAIAENVIPFFKFLGYSWTWLIGLLFFFGLIISLLATMARVWHECRHHGCGLWIFGALLGGVYTVIRMPQRTLRELANVVANSPHARDDRLAGESPYQALHEQLLAVQNRLEQAERGDIRTEKAHFSTFANGAPAKMSDLEPSSPPPYFDPTSPRGQGRRQLAPNIQGEPETGHVLDNEEMPPELAPLMTDYNNRNPGCGPPTLWCGIKTHQRIKSEVPFMPQPAFLPETSREQVKNHPQERVQYQQPKGLTVTAPGGKPVATHATTPLPTWTPPLLNRNREIPLIPLPRPVGDMHSAEKSTLSPGVGHATTQEVTSETGAISRRQPLYMMGEASPQLQRVTTATTMASSTPIWDGNRTITVTPTVTRSQT